MFFPLGKTGIARWHLFSVGHVRGRMTVAASSIKDGPFHQLFLFHDKKYDLRLLFRCRKRREIHTDERGGYVAYVGLKCLFGSFLPVETHEIYPDNHKRDTEPLAHVQRHAVLKVHLVFFRNSMKKRKVKISVRQSPKKKPR